MYQNLPAPGRQPWYQSVVDSSPTVCNTTPTAHSTTPTALELMCTGGIMEPLLYSRKLAASALSLSVRSIDYLIAQGRLKTVRVGAKNLIPRTEIFNLAKRGLLSAVSGL